MSAPIEDQLRTYFAYVEEEQVPSVVPSRSRLPSDNTHREIIVLDTEPATHTDAGRGRWLVSAAAVVLVAAVAGVLLFAGLDDDDPEEVVGAAPPSSPAEGVAEDFVVAFNGRDTDAVRALRAEARSGLVFGARDADELMALVPWFVLTDMRLDISSCEGEGRAVECSFELDSRFEEAPGFVHAVVPARITLTEAGTIEQLAVGFDNQRTVLLRDFVTFMIDRSVDDLDALFSAPGDGSPRPAATPEAMALWETYLERFIAEWSPDGS